MLPQLRQGYVLHRVLTEQSGATYNILKNKNFSLLSSLIDKVVNEQNNPF